MNRVVKLLKANAIFQTGLDCQQSLSSIGKNLNLDRLTGAWEAITDGRLKEYGDALPPEWMSAAETADVAIRFIMQLRDNIRPAIEEVLRCLHD